MSSMKIFAFSPSYLSVRGNGVHERSIVKRLMVTDHFLFIAAPRVLLLPSKKFTGTFREGRKVRFLSLPVIRPLILFDFIYGLLFSIMFLFYQLLGKKPFDVIYVRDLSAALVLISLRRWHKIPVVLKFVSFTADEYFPFPRNVTAHMASWIISMMEKVAIIKSDKVLVPTDLFKVELMSRYSVSGTKIVPLSSGVDIKEFSSSVGSKRTSSSFTIGYFGSLSYLNDIDCLLKALQLLKFKVNIKLILSTQSDPLEVKQKIEMYHLEGLVEVRSTPHNLMPKLMNEVDVVVIPRRRLSSTDLVLPLKLWEAGAAKKPVIIARTRIVEHELKDKVHVLMYEPENPEDLAAKILQLYKDETLRTNLGVTLFEYVKDYDWSVITSRLRNTLIQLLNYRGAPNGSNAHFKSE